MTSTPQVHDVVLEVLELVIYAAVSAFFGCVHVVELAEYHIEGFAQGVKIDDFPALPVAAAFDAKVGVDQQQRFDGQIVKLQIPG